MRALSEKEAIFKIPAILARLLEIPEKHVTFEKARGATAPEVVLRAGKYTFLVEFKSSGAKAPLQLALVQIEEERKALGQNVIPLLVVPYMGETGRQICDEHEVAWLDLSGNAHVKAAGLLIHIEGKPNFFKSAGRPASVFAPKSSRITRQLLIEPGKAFTQRELSRVTGLDEGHTSRIVRRLEEDRLIIRDKQGSLKPCDPNQLLDAWHEAYDFSRHRLIKGHIAARSGDELLHRAAGILHQHKIDSSATGLAAAWLFTRFASFRIVTFYFAGLPDENVMHALNFREDERGANTWLVLPNDEGVFQGSQVRDGIRSVHPVQIYLDLKGHPERASEAASMLRQQCLHWKRNA